MNENIIAPYKSKSDISIWKKKDPHFYISNEILKLGHHMNLFDI